MQKEEIVRRLCGLIAEAEKKHPDYIRENVIGPISDEIDDLMMDMVGLPAEGEMCLWPDDDEPAPFCRDSFSWMLFDNNTDEFLRAAADLREHLKKGASLANMKTGGRA